MEWLASQPGVDVNEAAVVSSLGSGMYVIRPVKCQVHLCVSLCVLQDDRTPFWAACDGGHLPVVEWLASQPGVDVNEAASVSSLGNGMHLLDPGRYA